MADLVAVARAGWRVDSPAALNIDASLLALTLLGLAIGLFAWRAGHEPADDAAGDGAANEFDPLFGGGAAAGLNPAQHPIRFAVLFATALGLALATVELYGEGPAPTVPQTVVVFFVRAVIEGVVTLAGTIWLGRWLGLLAPRGRPGGAARA